MTSTLFQLLGGIGLFLIGMSMLTDGLTTFAGNSLRQALARFTGTPFRAFTSGALITILLQSSTATTVTLIGFVSAGLISFTQAIGVVMGASLGTTGTGWIIATLGLKVSLGLYMLPLIGIGAFIKLLGRGRWPALGIAMAGFGMLFVGIDTLQSGMTGLSSMLNLESLQPDSWWHRILIMLIGTVMTVILQSSAAMVAATLTALDVGAISFEQAAILVIGAAIGTTMTGVLAAIGGSILARRTALTHVLFNLSSGLIALVILPLLLWLIDAMQTYMHLQAGAVALAAFNTLFIAVGVAIFLPNAARFARLMERLLPEKENTLTSQLDDSQLQVPELALGSMHKTLVLLSNELFSVGRQLCTMPTESPLSPIERQRLRKALDDSQEFFASIRLTDEHDALVPTHLAQMHVLDHLLRLYGRTVNVRLTPIEHVPAIMQEALNSTDHLLQLAIRGLSGQAEPGWLQVLAQQNEALSQFRQQARTQIMAETANGYRDSAQALHILDSMRWLERIVYHVWRICHYLYTENPAVVESSTDIEPA